MASLQEGIILQVSDIDPWGDADDRFSHVRVPNIGPLAGPSHEAGPLFL